jgi:Raf kinase inhibitor-like YbhB/YbcL family protein
MSIQISSPAFAAGEAIPRKFTPDGENVSPPLSWSDLPTGAKELVLVVDDPDAPKPEPWIHWVVYHLPATIHSLPENVAGAGLHHDAPAGFTQGVNSWEKVGWGGPQPPKGPPHHYRFTLYAIDRQITLPPRADAKTVLAEMVQHVIGKGQLVATYQK